MQSGAMAAVFAGINRLPWWRVPVTVDGFRLTPPTLDRAVYCWLHRLRMMGRDEMACFARHIRPGMRVIDVGANIGLYALVMARLAGPGGSVQAFEPDPVLAAALRANLAANAAATVAVHELAIGDGPGHGRLIQGALNRGDNHVVFDADARDSSAAREHSVIVRSLDALTRGQRVDFVKIDVQGREGDVIAGMSDLIARTPDLTIAFELWPHGLTRAGTSVASMAELVKRLRLEISALRPDGTLTATTIDDEAARLRRFGYVNLVAKRAACA